MSKTSSDYVPKLSIIVRQDQLDDLRQLLDWGLRSRLFEPIIDDLINLLKRDRAATTNLLLTRSIHLQDFLKEPNNGRSG